MELKSHFTETHTEKKLKTAYHFADNCQTLKRSSSLYWSLKHDILLIPGTISQNHEAGSELALEDIWLGAVEKNRTFDSEVSGFLHQAPRRRRAGSW